MGLYQEKAATDALSRRSSAPALLTSKQLSMNAEQAVLSDSDSDESSDSGALPASAPLGSGMPQSPSVTRLSRRSCTTLLGSMHSSEETITLIHKRRALKEGQEGKQ